MVYMHHNWLWLCLVVPLFFVSIYWFHRLYTYNTRKVAFLLDAIENDDPAVRFYEHSPDKDNSSVNMMLNRIARILYNVKQETAQREKYYELILDFVETGIVVLNSKGAVYQKNKKQRNYWEWTYLHIPNNYPAFQTTEKSDGRSSSGR